MQQHGFSLIELMIVVSIIGILSAIALPSYQSYAMRARFIEVVASTQPYKMAVALALQAGTPSIELNNGAHAIPTPPAPTKNVASVQVKGGIITAKATALAQNATYILSPNSNGTQWHVSGTCVKANLCDE